ncbi:MAG: prolyl oligopeptidase family serine peptidase [bacterium]|nr:prolyl oligopeptidase family serine peptidase [bacterium]
MSAFWLMLSAMATPGVSEIRDAVLSLDGGGELRYGISAPEVGEDAPARPLVLALHFGWQGEVPAHYGRNFLGLLVAPALGDLDAVIVAPDCPEGSWTHPRSEKALLALIEDVRETHDVDPRRIVVAGFSAGAMGTWFMASRHPDLFSAAIPLAGPPVLRSVPDAGSGLREAERFLRGRRVKWPPTLQETPILAIHSRGDELVSFELVDKAVRTLSAAGGRIELIALEGVGHFETPRYVEHLARAVPWLREIWRMESRSGDSSGRE